MPIGKIIETLTLEQKCALLSGGDTFKTREVAGIPQMWLSDGPTVSVSRPVQATIWD